MRCRINSLQLFRDRRETPFRSGLFTLLLNALFLLYLRAPLLFCGGEFSVHIRRRLTYAISRSVGIFAGLL